MKERKANTQFVHFHYSPFQPFFLPTNTPSSIKICSSLRDRLDLLLLLPLLFPNLLIKEPPNTHQRISPTLPSSSTRFAESSSADCRTAFRSFPSSLSLLPEHWRRQQSRIQQTLCGLYSRQRDPS